MLKDIEAQTQLPEQAPLWLRMTESAVITAGVPVLGWWLSPEDPFFVDASFPWLLLAPLLVGLRYGINAAALSVFLLIAIMALGWTHSYLDWDEFPLMFCVGMLVTVLLVGEFGSVWNKRLTVLRAMNDYRESRLREFTHAYNLMKQSHDALEQRLAANSTSLRACLISVRKELVAAPTTLGPLFDVGPLILRLFVHYGSLQSASLFAVDAAGRPQPEVLASVGDPDPVDLDLRMVREALSESRVTYVDADEEDNADEPAPLLAVIPVVDLDGQPWALICAERIPFRAYNKENLQRLAVMADYVGDLMRAKRLAPDARDVDEQIFMVQLERCVKDASRYHLPARVVGFRFVNMQTSLQLVGMLMAHTRGLDLNWLQSDRDGLTVLLVLLPLTGEIALGEYLASLEQQIKERYGFGNLQLAGIEVHSADVEGNDLPVDVLLRICDPCNVELADQLPDQEGLDGSLV